MIYDPDCIGLSQLSISTLDGLVKHPCPQLPFQEYQITNRFCNSCASSRVCQTGTDIKEQVSGHHVIISDVTQFSYSMNYVYGNDNTEIATLVNSKQCYVLIMQFSFINANTDAFIASRIIQDTKSDYR